MQYSPEPARLRLMDAYPNGALEWRMGGMADAPDFNYHAVGIYIGTVPYLYGGGPERLQQTIKHERSRLGANLVIVQRESDTIVGTAWAETTHIYHFDGPQADNENAAPPGVRRTIYYHPIPELEDPQIEEGVEARKKVFAHVWTDARIDPEAILLASAVRQIERHYREQLLGGFVITTAVNSPNTPVHQRLAEAGLHYAGAGYFGRGELPPPPKTITGKIVALLRDTSGRIPIPAISSVLEPKLEIDGIKRALYSNDPTQPLEISYR